MADNDISKNGRIRRDAHDSKTFSDKRDESIDGVIIESRFTGLATTDKKSLIQNYQLRNIKISVKREP